MDANRNSLSRMLSHISRPIDDTHLHQDTSNQGLVEVVEETVAKEEVVKVPGARKQF